MWWVSALGEGGRAEPRDLDQWGLPMRRIGQGKSAERDTAAKPRRSSSTLDAEGDLSSGYG